MAERITFQMFGSSASFELATCSISLDGPNRDGLDYVCTVTITGIGQTLTAPNYGVDPFQSLIMAIGWIYCIIKRYEDNGWQFYLSADRNKDMLYSCSVWSSTICSILLEPGERPA